MGVPLTVSTSLGRRTAYRAVWRERGINLPEIVVADYDTSHAREAVGAHLAALPASERPDVLICENNILAIGALEEIRGGLNLRVPEEIAVIGYGDIDFARLPSFDLTAIHQPVGKWSGHLSI